MLTNVKPALARPENQTSTGLFRPAPRGDLRKALSKTGELERIAPESPRPAEMLDSVELHQLDGFRLTADDEILHDLLASRGYEGDRSMPDQVHSFAVAEAVRYLNSCRIDSEAAASPDDKKGRNGGVERGDVLASLRRLKTATVSYGAAGGRRYSDVSLLEWWCETAAEQDVIRYRLPAPIRDLLGSQPRYAYLEMAALPAMSSKYSLRLYKRLALAASERKWVPGGDNVVRLSPTPEELAGWVGFPLDADGKVKAGKLKERVLDRIEADFRAVRAFRLSVEPRKGAGRGAPIQSIDLEVTVCPPDRRAVRTFFAPSKDTLRPGHKDIEKYRLESRTVRRANAKFGKAMLMTHGREYADLWQVALHEALSGEAISDGFATRPTRGARLLATVDAKGADYAAWALFAQECEDPDIRLARKADLNGYFAKEKLAEEARYERLGDQAPRGTRKHVIASGANEKAAPPAEEPQTRVAVLALEDCASVVFVVDPACGNYEVDDIGTFVAKMKWTGSRAVNVVLRFGADALETWTVGRYPVSEDDVDAVLKRFRTAIEIEEYE